MITFQFHGDVDYFEVDPVAYVPALGERGMAIYRAKLDEVRARLGPEPSDSQPWSVPDRHERWVLEWNDQRLAVLDHDVDAIIRTHAKDRKVAAWVQDTAEAFEEIGAIDLAIDWARQAVDFGPGQHSLKAADFWCKLLEEHCPGDALEARLVVFRRWPSATTAARLHEAAGREWPHYADEVVATLSPSPSDAVLFVLLTLEDAQFAWDLAHSLGLDSDRTWSELAKAYEKVDALAVLPVLNRLVENELVDAGAQHYRIAARRLARMRTLATGSDKAAEVDEIVAELREKHRRRPRLQQEFDRAGLP